MIEVQNNKTFRLCSISFKINIQVLHLQKDQNCNYVIFYLFIGLGVANTQKSAKAAANNIIITYKDQRAILFIREAIRARSFHPNQCCTVVGTKPIGWSNQYYENQMVPLNRKKKKKLGHWEHNFCLEGIITEFKQFIRLKFIN